MNSFQKLLVCILMGGLIMAAPACKDDDDDPVNCNYLTEVQDEIDALTAAANAWGADPSNATKCQAYKNAAQDYLDALESHVECAASAGQEDELQQAINDAQIQVDQIQC